MGHANGHIIALCERARKRGWKEVEALGKKVEKTQAECPHPQRDRKIRVFVQSTKKYKKGGKYEFCLRCSKMLRYMEPPKT